MIESWSKTLPEHADWAKPSPPSISETGLTDEEVRQRFVHSGKMVEQGAKVERGMGGNPKIIPTDWQIEVAKGEMQDQLAFEKLSKTFSREEMEVLNLALKVTQQQTKVLNGFEYGASNRDKFDEQSPRLIELITAALRHCDRLEQEK